MRCPRRRVTDRPSRTAASEARWPAIRGPAASAMRPPSACDNPPPCDSPPAAAFPDPDAVPRFGSPQTSPTAAAALAVSQQNQPAERANVGRIVGPNADRGIVAVVTQAGAGELFVDGLAATE